MKAIVHKLKNITLTTPIAILLGACILALGLVGYGLVSRPTVVGAPLTPFMGKAVDANDYVEGPNKKVFVIEYSDTECPYCVSFHPTIKQIRTEYAGRIGYVYRTFPLTSIHPHSQKEAESLMCAGKVGGSKGYFAYLTAMFDYKSNNQTTELAANGMEDLAKQASVDPQALMTCVNSGEMAQKVTAEENDGITAGVTGTPTTFVVVKEKDTFNVVSTIEGGRPYAFVKQAVEQALAR